MKKSVPPIVQDYVKFASASRDHSLSNDARGENRKKAAYIFSVMTASAQKLALKLAGPVYGLPPKQSCS